MIKPEHRRLGAAVVLNAIRQGDETWLRGESGGSTSTFWLDLIGVDRHALVETLDREGMDAISHQLQVLVLGERDA